MLIGILAGDRVTSAYAVLFAASLACWAAAAALARVRTKLWLTGVMLAFALLFLSWGRIAHDRFVFDNGPLSRVFEDRHIRVRGRVLHSPRVLGGTRSRVPLRVETVWSGGLKMGEAANVVVSYDGEIELQPGQTVDLYGLWHPYPWGVRGRLFDEYRPRGVIAVVQPQLILRERPPPLSIRVRNLRNNLIANLRPGLTEEESSLFASVAFGRRTVELDRDVVRRFRDSGLMHILVASGSQVSMLIAFFLLAIPAERTPLALATGLCAGVGIYVFGLVAGGDPSILRAVVMGIVVLLGRVLGREVDSLNSLALAALLWLFFNPYLVYSISFQLSYAATFGIFALGLPLRRIVLGTAPFTSGVFRNARPREKKDLRERGRLTGRWSARFAVEIGAMTLGAQLMVAPVILWHFGSLATMGLLSNLIAIPLATLLLYLGVASGLMGSVWVGFSIALNWLASFPLRALDWTADVFSRPLPLGIQRLSVEEPSLLWLVLYYAGALWLCVVLSRRAAPASLLGKGSGDRTPGYMQS